LSSAYGAEQQVGDDHDAILDRAHRREPTRVGPLVATRPGARLPGRPATTSASRPRPHARHLHLRSAPVRLRARETRSGRCRSRRPRRHPVPVGHRGERGVASQRRLHRAGHRWW
jgi:hypothetical protein